MIHAPPLGELSAKLTERAKQAYSKKGASNPLRRLRRHLSQRERRPNDLRKMIKIVAFGHTVTKN